MAMLKYLALFARECWLGYAVALGTVGAVSAASGLGPGSTQLANVSMLYLVAVLGVAAAFGSGPAVLASLLAFLSFNFLFVDPRYSFSVADPTEWIVLLGFLITAAVTGQLAAALRRRAEEARQREREAMMLYDLARLMSEIDLSRGLSAVAERLREAL